MLIPSADRIDRCRDVTKPKITDVFCENPQCLWQTLPLPKEHYIAHDGRHYCDRLCCHEAEQERDL